MSLDPSSIVIALSGGLGNQMFQYAVGRALALRNHAPLLLDTRALDNDTLRDYALGEFRISGSVARPEQLPPAPGRIRRRLDFLPRWLSGNRFVLEQSFTYNPDILMLKPPLHLAGNWQTEKYFGHYATLIRSDFQLSGAMTPERASIAMQIAAGTAVSVHVRRGDYVSNPSASAYHGTCDPPWYAAAKLQIEEQVSKAQFFVFSDDPDWARANLGEFSDAIFVEPSSDGRDEQDLHLMAACRHHIIANSSFSWWGAWLDPDPDKIVIAPRQWFKGASHDTRDLIPPSWTRL